MNDTSAGRSERHRNVWVILGGLAVLPVVLSLLLAASRPDHDDVYAAASNAAYELRRTPVTGLIPTIFDVEDAVKAGTRAAVGSSAAVSCRT